MSRIAPILCVLALAVPAAAAAQSSDEGYGGSGGVAGQVESRDEAPAQPVDEPGALPFSGAELAVLLAAGGFLALTGYGLRRLTLRRLD